MNMYEKLREAQKNATGAYSAFLGTLMSLPEATCVGLIDTFQGKSPSETSVKIGEIMDRYARSGEKYGREKTDKITKDFLKVIEELSKHKK